MLERSANKSFTVEPKRSLFLDVRTSSLEVDLRMPGNRDDFPFSLAEWSLPSYFAPFCTFPAMFSLMRENLSSHG